MKMRRWFLLAMVALALVAVALGACGGGGDEAPPQETPPASMGQIQLNPHPASLEGKMVVLRWNGKPNGDKLLNSVGDLLTQQVPGVKVVKMWEIDPSTAVSSDSNDTSVQLAEKIAAQNPDLVIASQCD
jgi:ABC-type Fe3+-hydroxamate transport system substrate-binding protein